MHLQAQQRLQEEGYVVDIIPEGYVMDEEAARAILACNDRSDLKKLLAKWKQQSPNGNEI